MSIIKSDRDNYTQVCCKITLKNNDLIEYSIPKTDIWNQATVLGRAGKSITAAKFWYNIKEKET